MGGRVFDGKVALVTGATGGIGRATAVAFAQAGACVVVAGRRRAEGQETLKRISAAGSEGLFVETDVSVEADVAAMLRRTADAFGRLDYAFNNAGTLALGPVVAQTEEAYHAVMNTNVGGVLFCLKHEIMQMRRSGGGAIVNSSSLAGLVGRKENALYSASKHAVIGLTRSAALEVAAEGIRINTVCPAFIEGAMDETYERYFGLSREELVSSVPLGHGGTPEDVAEAVIFLCSDRARFITGAALAIDGGTSA